MKAKQCRNLQELPANVWRRIIAIKGHPYHPIPSQQPTPLSDDDVIVSSPQLPSTVSDAGV